MTADATSAFLRAMRDRIGSGAAVSIEEIVSRSWASATFSGARHELLLALEGDGAAAAADAFAHNLEAAEFTLRGHILADIALASREQRGARVRLRVEALTVEES